MYEQSLSYGINLFVVMMAGLIVMSHPTILSMQGSYLAHTQAKKHQTNL